MLQMPLKEPVQSPVHSVPVREPPSAAEQSHPALSWVLKVAGYSGLIPGLERSPGEGNGNPVQ